MHRATFQVKKRYILILFLA